MNNEESEFGCRLKKKCINRRIALIGNLFVSFLVFQILLDNVSYAQYERVAPGVNPNKYQQEVPVAQQGKIMKGLSDLGINRMKIMLHIYHFAGIVLSVTIY